MNNKIKHNHPQYEQKSDNNHTHHDHDGECCSGHDISHFTTKKVGRNDLCPCGSGKKYKKCCA